ncbi:MAG: hypothetical protein GC164_03410 [Phycisphaera sp.]|nr:hypothetical protein [Phycisphaera sp.]
MNTPTTPPAQTVDLFDLIDCWKKRLPWIVIVSFIAAALAYAATYLVTPQYTASGIIYFDKPSMTTSFDPRVAMNLSPLPAKGLDDLAKSDDILTPVYKSALESGRFKEDTTFDLFKRGCSAELTGNNLLILSVKYEDPQTAAALCGDWVAHVTRRLNEMMGTGTDPLKDAQARLEENKLAWQKAQDEAEKTLGQTNVMTRQSRSEQLRNNMVQLLDRAQHSEIVLEQAKALRDRIARTQPATEQVGLGNALAVMGLQGAGNMPGDAMQMQVDADSFDKPIMTVQQALDALDQVILASQELTESLRAMADELQERIGRLVVELEQARHTEALVLTQRDVARRNYETTINQIEQLRMASLPENAAVRVAAAPQPPTDKSWPRRGRITVGLGLFVFVAMSLLLTLRDASRRAPGR